MTRYLPALLVLVGLSSCGGQASNIQTTTATAVGGECLPDDVTVGKDLGGCGTRTWVATCKDQRYLCESSVNDEIDGATCTLSPK